MTRRDLAPTALIVASLTLLGLLAWLTRAPEAPIFERASRLPLIGGTVSRLRELYLPPEPTSAGHPPPAAQSAGSRAAAGEPQRFSRAGLGEVVLLVPGEELRDAPNERAAVVERIDRPRRTLVLEHAAQTWVRVMASQGGSAWVDPRVEPGAPPPLGMEPSPPTPLPGHPPSPERLEEARLLLGADARQGRLGPYLLLTDTKDDRLEAYLDRLARRAEEEYVTRYDLELEGDAAEAVVLFRDQAAYRRYEASIPQLAGIGAEGHAGLGVVSLYQGHRSALEIGLTLLHELGHLHNRRALGPALPPWLDEGLAEDFSHWAVRASEEGPYGRFRLREESGERLVGPLASLELVGASLMRGRLESPLRLLQRDWSSFAAAGAAPLNYAHAELWVRFLAEGAGEGVRHGWRAYLEDVRRGGPVDAQSLRARLRLSWDELARAFRSWVFEEASAAGLDIGAPP